jgi:hypothetical protein
MEVDKKWQITDGFIYVRQHGGGEGGYIKAEKVYLFWKGMRFRAIDDDQWYSRSWRVESRKCYFVVKRAEGLPEEEEKCVGWMTRIRPASGRNSLARKELSRRGTRLSQCSWAMSLAKAILDGHIER